MDNQEFPRVRIVTAQEEFTKKHPVLVLILSGFGVMSFGIILTMFLITAIIGIPLLFIGGLMVLLGILLGSLSLLAKIFPFLPKPSEERITKITNQTKKFGLLMPKFMRSKELRQKYE